MAVRLHVNVDHVATLRNARGTSYPDPVEAAVLCEHAGADGITVHLREDRRHIVDRDVELLRRTVKTLLNLEMAATAEMVEIAARVKPDKVTLVPERREERTTEGGLDVAGHERAIGDAVARLGEAGVPVSLFIAPQEQQLHAAHRVGVPEIELHTGDYANATGERARQRELERIEHVVALKLSSYDDVPRIAAGHGLTVRNTAALVASCPAIEELNIGHALVSDAVYFGLAEAVQRFREAIAEGIEEQP